jgi:hypothetical protein
MKFPERVTELPIYETPEHYIDITDGRPSGLSAEHYERMIDPS